MTVIKSSGLGKIQHLSLDDLSVNPRLARRLPPALACRYHALPVAEDGGRITVAMADPDDEAARQAIVTILGANCCVVRGDPATIDALLAEVWPAEAHRSLRLLVCTHVSPIAPELWDYGQAMGNLLSARVDCVQPTEDHGALFDALAEGRGHTGYDLVILGEPDQSLVEQLLSHPADGQATDWVIGALLFARPPRWPLRKILLLIQGKETDSVAVDWVVRLAGPSAASVIVLTMMQPVPAALGREVRVHPGLNALLTTDTTLGQELRRVARRLVNWEIESTLRLCQGTPDQWIRREAAEGDYDLIVLAAQPCELGPSMSCGYWSTALLGELVSLLLRWANQPILIVRPTPSPVA